MLRQTIPLLCLLSAGCVRADVTLPALFSDHVMLQRERPVRVWGKATPGEAVTVRIPGQTASATADDEGHWSLFLEPMKAGGPHELSIQGKNTITIKDVLVGDVWIGSGQSNMQWTVQNSNNAEQEIAAAKHPQIRLFRVALKSSDVPLDDVEGEWMVTTPENIKGFSAVGYFFSRALHQHLKTPIGFIQTAWGGTPADSWISQSAIASDPALVSVFSDWAQHIEAYPRAMDRYARALAQWEANGKTGNRPGPPIGPGHSWTPGGLYNAMIAPLTPFAIKGAIWYQGENNSGKNRSYVYRRLFPAMIQDWRNRWGQGDFPFLWAQLANFKTKGQWPELQEAQTMTLRLANTGQAVINDIGNPTDIHPRNKQDVGARLALAARAIAYGEKLTYSGPVLRQVTTEGSALRVWLDHTGKGLAVRGGGDLRGFTIAGADGKFVPAQAKIEGTTVVLMSPDVKKPVHVRYAWADDPDANLINQEGLPAGLFRTDPWVDPTLYR
jgi:sialate O-acetylesterase